MLNRHLSGGTSPDGPPEGATSRSWFQLNKAHFSQSWRSCRQSWVSPPTPHPRELCSQHVAGDLPSVHAPDRDVDGSPATRKHSPGRRFPRLSRPGLVPGEFAADAHQQCPRCRPPWRAGERRGSRCGCGGRVADPLGWVAAPRHRSSRVSAEKGAHAPLAAFAL